MTGIIEWLLDLQDIRLGHGAGLVLEWNRPPPPWLLACLAVAAVVAVAMVYRHERASLPVRCALASVRLAVVGLVVAVLCEPSLVMLRNRIEKSYVSLVLDTSLSMAASESYADQGLAGAVARGAGVEDQAALAKHSRLELIEAALARNDGAALRTLLKRNALQLSTFAGAVETRAWAASQESLDDLVNQLASITARDLSTDIAGAIDQTIADARGRRLAAIVLATDGQSTEPTNLKDALDVARGRQIPVFTIRIGSCLRPRDTEIGLVRADETVFVRDLLAVEAQLSARGLVESTPVTVLLINEREGRTVASREVTLDPADSSTTVELTTKPVRIGTVRYRVEALPIFGEQLTENNAGYVDVRVLDDRLRVLYVEGYPRYEYRYLKNALLREETVDLSVLLIEADEQFVQEGTTGIRRFPDTPEELNRYDVVLFGDVDPRSGWLTAAQMRMLLDFVGNHGGGFGLIAGERAAPHRFAGIPLEKLIPVRIDPQFLGRYDSTLADGFKAQLTSDGRRSRLFRWDVEGQHRDTDAADDGTSLESLPELFWIMRTLGPKPGASVITHHPTWHTVPTGTSRAELLPLVVLGRYGAGRVFFQATDDTWRWRRHGGEHLHDTYWVRVVRELMRGDRLAQSRRLVIRTDRRKYAYGKQVRVLLEVFDPQLPAGHPEKIEITVRQEGIAAPGQPGSAGSQEDAAAMVVARVLVHRLGSESARYEGTYLPPFPGSFSFQVEGLATRPGQRPASTLVYVERPDLEGRRPEADHEVLGRIAEATGGRMIDLDQLEDAFDTVRDRSAEIPDDLIEPLWDSKLVLALFVLMISMEWILRKAFGLL